ncbi:hypothetical protein ASPSYDRAFT_47614 [Aspergillus sydowii CBS 593.65]|uniref:Uncharacterized protein n=1 Tax=Aspergillus sydowii CBS 593.65 TaxID=1036612 RepID=A0A1L9TAD0_9EURO|nr:uncharacterized protein ASPSYDRAFT_47614 [Aspergillus sydowii CBS 593.65]OJJ56325.1 hypothetical protein ASPSYDRAFT_47614 [Aspergillus sydowii CBS 593.65]
MPPLPSTHTPAQPVQPVQTPLHPVPYLIQLHLTTLSGVRKHRAADPLFALAIGSSAALLRIRREEKEKNPDSAAEIGYGTVLGTGGERLRRWWNGEFDGLVAGGTDATNIAPRQ